MTQQEQILVNLLTAEYRKAVELHTAGKNAKEIAVALGIPLDIAHDYMRTIRRASSVERGAPSVPTHPPAPLSPPASWTFEAPHELIDIERCAREAPRGALAVAVQWQARSGRSALIVAATPHGAKRAKRFGYEFKTASIREDGSVVVPRDFKLDFKLRSSSEFVIFSCNGYASEMAASGTAALHDFKRWIEKRESDRVRVDVSAI